MRKENFRWINEIRYAALITELKYEERTSIKDLAAS